MIFLSVIHLASDKTSEVLVQQPRQLPDSVTALNFPSPAAAASSTKSEIAATQESMESSQEQVLESELGIVHVDKFHACCH